MLEPEMVPAKRRQILSGARQVFGELGFERASVDLIAARAGVSKATVYNHFEDKKALFVAAVVQEADEMRARFRGCLDGAGAATGLLLDRLHAASATTASSAAPIARAWQGGTRRRSSRAGMRSGVETFALISAFRVGVQMRLKAASLHR